MALVKYIEMKEFIMKKHIFFLLFLAVLASSVFAQTREDISVFIAPVVANPDQAAFFYDNFVAETEGAGYTLAKDKNDADYTLKLEVKPNLIRYDDGTEEQAPPDEKQSVLQVTLIRNEDAAEVVTFNFAFTTVDEMYEYNLYLVYEAMANVPFSKPGNEGVSWRNKWLYLRASFDYPITFYQLLEPMALWGDHPTIPGEKQWHNLDHRINPFPAVTFGIEFQYLNWMSTELNFNLSFSDPFSATFIPAIQFEQKFPVKPSKHFMIEPYAAVSFPVNTSSTAIQFPKVGVGGGVQVGVKGGNMGAFFVDVNYIHYLGNVVMKNENIAYPNPSEIHYTRFVIGLGIGYKIGFFDRNKG
jgi:hypothetical protein